MILTGVALADPESAPEHELLQNPIPALKKEAWNGFPRQKNISNMSDAGLPFRWRKTIGNADQSGASVTTSHVFRPNQRRNVRLSLRFRLPNSSVPMVNVTPQWPCGAGGVR